MGNSHLAVKCLCSPHLLAYFMLWRPSVDTAVVAVTSALVATYSCTDPKYNVHLGPLALPFLGLTVTHFNDGWP